MTFWLLVILPLNHDWGLSWFSALLGAAILTYQLSTGTLVGIRQITRKENGRRFWTVFTIEAVFVLLLLTFGILTWEWI